MGLFALKVEQIEGDLGSVDERGASLRWNGAGDDPMGGAGKKIADPFLADEQWHRIAEGLIACKRGSHGFRVNLHYYFCFFADIVGTLLGFGAAAEGGFCAGSVCGWIWGAGG